MLTKKEQRLRRSRQTRIRIATQGVARLTVNRTNLHIYASRDLRRRLQGAGHRLHRRSRSAQGTRRRARAATSLPRSRSASASLKRRRPPASRRSPSTAPVSRTTAASRRWPKRPAKPACSSNGHGIRNGKDSSKIVKATVRKTACKEKMIAVNRVTKVVKGGRILGFAALTVVGDGTAGRHGQGQVEGSAAGRAEGHGRSPPQHDQVSLKNGTIHHNVFGHHGAAAS
jgi:hypothetical protein